MESIPTSDELRSLIPADARHPYDFGFFSNPATSRCATPQVDAVIVDLLMRRVNGFEVIPKLRTQYPKIGIVAYTAVAGGSVRQDMTGLGVPVVWKSGQSSGLDAVLGEIARED